MLIFRCNIEVFVRFPFFSKSQFFDVSDSLLEINFGAFGSHFNDFGWFGREVKKDLFFIDFKVPGCPH